MPHSVRILVVEDDSGIREIIRTRLRMMGHEVETARTGVEALSRIKAWHPDAMVLDINMPELDGFGVLKSFENARDSLPPTLVITARNAAEDVRQAVSLGAKDYLSKPFSEGQLESRVARLLRFPKPKPPHFV
ncbi:MAG TPA: response regulator [Caulobacteraceae bacterium]|jgi:two-component system OmpR family response regulator